ncbi:MAG TPA: hypothetical protein PK144_13800, partial [Plasticicumulans sp.]|nr:hypothetical protein [Plasticicumulans sp.]
MTRNRSVLRLVLLYAVLGIAWTVFAERILLALAPDGLVLSELEAWKGVVFVIFSAGFLFLAAGGLREPDADDGQDPVPRGAGGLVGASAMAGDARQRWASAGAPVPWSGHGRAHPLRNDGHRAPEGHRGRPRPGP